MKNVKDYAGYVLGLVNNTEELNEFEVKFMELEKGRLDKEIPIEDLEGLMVHGKLALQDISNLDFDDTEQIIFEGMKGSKIILNIIDKGDTYKEFFEKLNGDTVLKRAYNTIVSNCLKIIQESGAEVDELEIA